MNRIALSKHDSHIYDKLTFVGGKYSGVSFHLHGPGYSETIIGSKHWFLYPPHMTERVKYLFSPNMTVAQWAFDVYPNLDCNSMKCDQTLYSELFECTISPGEVLYFPSHWMHATLNLDLYNAFFSVFVDTHLISRP